jgi:hypothetical protein
MIPSQKTTGGSIDGNGVPLLADPSKCLDGKRSRPIHHVTILLHYFDSPCRQKGGWMASEFYLTISDSCCLTIFDSC